MKSDGVLVFNLFFKFEPTLSKNAPYRGPEVPAKDLAIILPSFLNEFPNL